MREITRKTERGGERQRERQTEKERETDREKERQTERETERRVFYGCCASAVLLAESPTVRSEAGPPHGEIYM